MIAAALPILYPRELLRSFGVLPVELWGPPGTKTAIADRWLQAYTCSIIRGGLAFLAGGGQDHADIILVPHGCDSLQGLGSVLLDFPVLSKPALSFYHPRTRSRASVDYLEAEIESLAEELQKITGREATDALEATIREEEADSVLAKLLAGRLQVALSCRDYYRLVRCREYLPAEQFTALARPWLSSESGPSSAMPVLLSGVVPEPSGLLDALNEAGAVVVADDTIACGRRLTPEGRDQSAYRRMAERMASAPPCPTRGASVEERSRHLLDLAKRSGAKAVVFAVVKFCEPELFQLPLLKTALERAGLRTTILEVDVTEPLPQQLKTRMEALLETMS